VATAGLALLVRAGAHTGHAVLLPAFLPWGIGMGFLTPAVVAAAIAAVPAHRSGPASAVDNTACQTGGAIGIAVAGAVAGQPADGARFVRGFHAVALGAAASTRPPRCSRWSCCPVRCCPGGVPGAR
jgi:DHA2 family methylenomycin A resistance protein-like MFS transporter